MKFLPKIVPFAFLLLLSPAAQAQSGQLLDAIRMVESGGRDVVGDNGAAIGPYQIHRACWQDAVDFDKSIGGTYKDCHKEGYARKICAAYLRRYGKGHSAIEMANIWNAGPKGWKRGDDSPYARKIRAEMEKR
jgi:hypothetical protein